MGFFENGFGKTGFFAAVILVKTEVSEKVKFKR
jgi:hypothetical protein